MSTHSYSRLWTHLIWETLDREPMLDKSAAAKASSLPSIASGRIRKSTRCLLIRYGLEWRSEKNHYHNRRQSRFARRVEHIVVRRAKHLNRRISSLL